MDATAGHSAPELWTQRALTSDILAAVPAVPNGRSSDCRSDPALRRRSLSYRLRGGRVRPELGGRLLRCCFMRPLCQHIRCCWGLGVHGVFAPYGTPRHYVPGFPTRDAGEREANPAKFSPSSHPPMHRVNLLALQGSARCGAQRARHFGSFLGSGPMRATREQAALHVANRNARSAVCATPSLSRKVVTHRTRAADPVRHAPGGLLHATFLLALCAFLIAQPFIRDRGGVVFWAFVAIAALYALATRRPIMIRPLLAFTLVGLLYVVLSYFDILPDAWTKVYQRAFIPRQAFYVVLLYPLALAASSMWSYAARSGKTVRFFLVILIAVAGIAPLVEVLFTDNSLVSAYASVTTGGLGNARLLFYVALSYFLIVRIRKVAIGRFYVLLAAIVIFIVFGYLLTNPQIQNIIGIGIIIVISMIRRIPRNVITMVLAGMVLYAMLVPFAARVYVEDANSGYRLILVKDAIRAFVDSYGMGVGFGKEVVTNEYDEFGISRSPAHGDSTELAVAGVHNSFAQEFMRLGLLGGGCLVWLFFVTCCPPRDGPLRVRRHLAVVYLLLLISMMVNVALESPTYLVGIAFALGYIVVTKDRISRQDGQLEANAAPFERTTPYSARRLVRNWNSDERHQWP